MRECDGEQENQYNENIQNNKKERKAVEDIRLTAMGSFAESKARKRASVLMMMNLRKIQRNKGVLGLMHFNIYVKKQKITAN